MPKSVLRDKLLAQRRQMPVAAIQSLGRRAQQRLLQSQVFLHAKTVGLYHPIQNEVDTDLLLQAALRRCKTVAYPRVRGKHLDMVIVTGPEDLMPGAYGVREPVGQTILEGKDIHLLVLPGVGFDRQGGRLGYGQGFYDRLLGAGTFAGTLVGLCYGFQLRQNIPTEPHDMPVHYVATEKELLAIREHETVV